MQHRSSSARSARGFTIVELLIVIVVIAVLAAITVVAYNGIRERADSTAIISQAQAYIKGLKIWEADNGGARPQFNSCIAPSSYTTCPSSPGWNTNTPVNSTFMSSLGQYSGVTEMQLGKYGPQNPTGSMWYVENYWNDNRAVLYYTVGPNTNCGLPNVLTPTPGNDNMTLTGATYTARSATSTQCYIEVSKW